MLSQTAVSERKACSLVGITRISFNYHSNLPVQDHALTGSIVELAQERSRFGYRRIHALLKREGVEANHKRVYRLCSSQNLAVKRHGVTVPMEPLQLPTQRNEVWAMDFVMDALATGRRIKILTIVYDCTKESVDLVADHGIGGQYVVRILDQVARFRGYPTAIRTDQGPEFTSKVLDQWAYEHGVQLKLI